MLKNNKKGFTLVELLAVIVVLAIIMVVAVPSVMDAMTKARVKSFKIYAQRVMTLAQTQYQFAQLNVGDTNPYGAQKPSNASACYNIKTELGLTSTGNYSGYVVVMGGTTPTYYLTLTDNNSSYTNKKPDQLETEPAAPLSPITGCPTATFTP